jgi:hypothetical protein
MAHPSSASFELAVTAAASIGVHLAGEGFEAQLVTDVGVTPRQGAFQDALLDALAVVKSSRSATLHEGISALRTGGGQIIAVLGHLTAEEARDLAATRHGTAPAMALVLGADAGAAEGNPPASRPSAADPPARSASAWNREHAIAAQVLISAGWRAVLVSADTPLAVAWQELHRLPMSTSTVSTATMSTATVQGAPSGAGAGQ